MWTKQSLNGHLKELFVSQSIYTYHTQIVRMSIYLHVPHFLTYHLFPSLPLKFHLKLRYTILIPFFSKDIKRRSKVELWSLFPLFLLLSSNSYTKLRLEDLTYSSRVFRRRTQVRVSSRNIRLSYYTTLLSREEWRWWLTLHLSESCVVRTRPDTSMTCPRPRLRLRDYPDPKVPLNTGHSSGIGVILL